MQTAVRKGNLRRILIVVGIVLVLAIIGTLVYLFGIDMKRDRYYQPEVSQVRLAHILDELKQPTRMGFETFTVEERGREGIYCIAAMDDLGREEVEGGPTTIQQFAGQYNQYLVFPAQDIEMEIEEVKYHKNFVLLKLKGIEDINEAEKYKTCYLKIHRDNARKLPEGTYFIADLIGLNVYTEDGTLLGKVDDIYNSGANDIYVIKDELGKQILLPALKKVIKQIDIDNEKIIVHLLEGLI